MLVLAKCLNFVLGTSEKEDVKSSYRVEPKHSRKFIYLSSGFFQRFSRITLVKNTHRMYIYQAIVFRVLLSALLCIGLYK